MKVRYSWIMVWLLTVTSSLMAEVNVNEVIGGKRSLLEFYKREFKELFKECKYAKEQDLRNKVTGLKGKLAEIKQKRSVKVRKKSTVKVVNVEGKEVAPKAASKTKSKKPSRIELMNVARELSIQGSNLRKLESLKGSVERTRKAITNVQDVTKLNKRYCSLSRIASDFSNLKTEIALKVKVGGKYKVSKSGRSMQELGNNFWESQRMSLSELTALMQPGKRKSKPSAKNTKNRKPKRPTKNANEQMYSRKNATKVKYYYRHAKEKKARLLQCMLVLTNQAIEAPEDFFPVEGKRANKKPHPAVKNKALLQRLDPKPPSWQKIKDDIRNLELTGALAKSELVLLEKALRNLSRFSERWEKAGKDNKSIASSMKRIEREWGKLVQNRYGCALLLSESCKLRESQKGNVDPIVVSRMVVLNQLRNQFRDSMGLYLTRSGLLNKDREAYFEKIVRYQEKLEKLKEKEKKEAKEEKE